MDKGTKKWLAIISVAIALLVIVLLLLSEFDLSGFKIYKGIKIS